jgi:iron complex outermembrane receptor protein
VTENVALTVDAVNLTDENIVQYSGDKSRPRGIYDNGRQYYAGVRVRF